MTIPEDQISKQLSYSSHLMGLEPEQKRLQSLSRLGLLEAESIPIFEEAIQTAAHFLDMPICILGLMDQDREWLKSCVGLSRLGLMNELASSRQIPYGESFCTKVVETQQVLILNDTLADPEFADRLLVKRYRIRAYLGVPLIDSEHNCLGVLAVMDLVPRTFTTKDVEFLELTARWSMSEFERDRLTKVQKSLPSVERSQPDPLQTASSTSVYLAINPLKVELLSHLTQELRTPLTSVMGMASVLNREIYGALTVKQKEYLDIIYQSGQYLLSLVNEIVELGGLDDSGGSLNLDSVDIEMLCQQAINTLEQAANRREQQIQLSIEPGGRIWLLDKKKVRQVLYHLIFSVIQASGAGSIIRIHISRKQGKLNIAIWVSHPWLGDSLPYSELYATQSTIAPLPHSGNLELPDRLSETDSNNSNVGWAESEMPITPAIPKKPAVTSFLKDSRENVGLLLSRQLAEMHGGSISIQGSQESGYRYVVSLPQMTKATEVISAQE